MPVNSRILVVVDPTLGEDQPSLKRATWLARKQGTDLELFVCFSDQFDYSDFYVDARTLKKIRSETVRRRRDYLEKLAAPLRTERLKVATTAVWDAPLDEGIVRHVLRTEPSMVIKATHYHSKVARALLSRADWGLIRKCPVPLLLVKDREWVDGAPVVAAIDPLNTHDRSSTLDAQIMEVADKLSRFTKGELHVFHSYPQAAQLIAVAAYVPEGTAGMDERIKRTHAKRIDEFLSRSITAPQVVHIEQGRVENVLPKLARSIDAGVIVMGAVSRNVFERAMIGSTAEKIIDTLRCDLLVVKPPWFTSRVDEHCPLFSAGDDLSSDNRYVATGANHRAPAHPTRED